MINQDAPICKEIQVKYRGGQPQVIQPSAQTDEFIANASSLSMSNALKIVGDSGLYQHYIINFLCFGFFSKGLIGILLSYVYYIPKFYCLTNGSEYTACTQQDVCSGKYVFMVGSERQSIVTDFGAYCGEKRLYILKSQALIFTLAAVITFMVSIFSDRVGRKIVYYIMFFTFMLGFSLAIISQQLGYISAGMVLVWTAIDIYYSNSVLYLNEISGNYLRARIAKFFIFSAAGAILINFVLIYITNYKSFLMICLACISTFSIFLSKIIESPFILFTNGKIKSCYDSLFAISVFNRTDKQSTQKLKEYFKIETVIEKPLEEVEEISILNNTSSFNNVMETLNLLFQDIYLFRLIGGCILGINIYVNESVTLLIPQRLGIDDIYLMNILIHTADLLGLLLLFPVSHLISKKRIYIGVCFGILSVAFLLYVNEFNKANNTYQLVATTASCLMKFIQAIGYSVVINYIAELFPTKIRGLATGIIICISRMSHSLAPSIDHIAFRMDTHPLILTSIPALFAVPVALFMPETHNKDLIN